MRSLRPNKSTGQPTNLVFFDCETLPEGGGEATDYGLHKLRFGCASYVRLVAGIPTRRQTLTFTESEQFWDWLDSLSRAKSCLWVFAHNLGFDATIVKLWERIENETLKICEINPGHRFQNGNGKTVQPKSPLLILDDPPTVLSLENRNGNRFKFLDTLNYWRCSLSALGAGIGLKKLDMPQRNDSDTDWSIYCERDVEIIERAVIGLLNWVKSEDLGMFRLTSPSQAMAAFRHRFYQHKIVYHDDKQCRQLERQSYFGGQVEVYHSGTITKTIHQLDVTSLYPSVMSGNLYPWRLSKLQDNRTMQPDWPFSRGLDKVAEVTIATMERTYPVKLADGVYHCNGRFETTLCGPELDYALQHDHVEMVGKFATYSINNLFDDYVAYFWRKRREYKELGNTLGDTLCKLLLNSLYGKFGQCGSEWVTLPTNSLGCSWGNFVAVDALTGLKTTYRCLGPIAQMKVDSEEIDGAFPAIAAYVTAYGREKMYRLRQIAGESEVYYQAVDALYTSDLGLDRLRAAGEVGQKELGKLELVSSVSSAEFRSINNYTIGGKTVRGSIKPNAKLVGEKTWVEPHFQHLASILSAPLQGGVKITKRTKVMKEEYSRRHKLPHEATSPITLGY